MPTLIHGGRVLQWLGELTVMTKMLAAFPDGTTDMLLYGYLFRVLGSLY
jgi:hypothetical protein